MIAEIRKSEIFGEVSVSGAKNSFFPAVASGIALGAQIVKIKNVPIIDDVMTMLAILEEMGCSYKLSGNTLTLDVSGMTPRDINEGKFGAIRGSVVVFGAMLSRFGRAKIPMPGGCRIGKRPIDQHIKSARQIGFSVEEEKNTVKAGGTPKKKAKVKFDIKTVTGTENAILMSLRSDEVEIENPAEEPEVEELIKYLGKYGVDIKKEKGKIFINSRGVYSPREVEFELIPDRIEAGTWLILAGATAGELTVKNAVPEHLDRVISALREAGAEVKIGKNRITVRGKGEYNPVDITAEPYPGFPTDMQPQMCVMMFRGKGKSRIKDTIFPERLSHVEELRKMGGEIKVNGKGEIIIYPSRLKGSRITAKDLRSTAALVIAGLISDGKTLLENFNIIKRGYENFVEKLRRVGGKIRVEDSPKRKKLARRKILKAGMGDVSYTY